MNKNLIKLAKEHCDKSVEYGKIKKTDKEFDISRKDEERKKYWDKHWCPEC